MPSHTHIGPLRVDESLPNASTARELLERVADSSEPILKSHGFKVQRLEEITKNLNRMKGVLGFCEPAGDGKSSYRIALVLRDDDGQTMSFVEAMGVMLHEIAHIQHYRHAGPFYRFMAELIEEWETVVMMVPKGRLLDSEGNAMSENIPHNSSFNGCFTGVGKKLGGARTNWKCQCQRDLARYAAERRAADAMRGFGDAELVPIARGMLAQQRAIANPTKRQKLIDTGDYPVDEKEVMSLIRALHESEKATQMWRSSGMEDAISLSIAENEKQQVKHAIRLSIADGQKKHQVCPPCSMTRREQMELDHAIALSISTGTVAQ